MARRPGRRPRGDTDTRETIRQAARERFAERGYAATTIRAVAERAGVDPALVMHFFGSKDGLFEACVQWPFDPDEQMGTIAAAGTDGAGVRLAGLFVSTWEAHGGRNPVVTLLRAAMDQDAAAGLLREFLQVRLLVPLMTGLGLDRPDLRAALVASQLIGLGAARYVLRLDGLAALAADEVTAQIAPTIQRYLSEPLPG